jgi:hypothetical protein
MMLARISGGDWESTNIAFLVLGLALQHNLLVLSSAIALPVSGLVSQRYVGALWAWSIAVVLGGAMLVMLSLRLVARRAAERPGR